MQIISNSVILGKQTSKNTGGGVVNGGYILLKWVGSNRRTNEVLNANFNNSTPFSL